MEQTSTTNAATPAINTTTLAEMDAQQKDAVLAGFDFVLCVDKSGSMSKEDVIVGGKPMSRYDSAKESVIALARDLCKIDKDGIGLVMFGGTPIPTFDNCDATKVEAAFNSNRPSGTTPLAEALAASLKLLSASPKKKFIVVLTDGEPDNAAAAEKVIVDQANSQNADEDCTFLFLQVGHDAGATAYLTHLDDGLTGKAKFDIVDTITIDQLDAAASIKDLILTAIVD